MIKKPIKCKVLFWIEREIRITFGCPFWIVKETGVKADYVGWFTE